MKVEMYVTPVCGYCTKAKALLRQKGVSVEEHDISGNEALIEEMYQRSGGRTTVPQIFISERHIGGCDDLFALDGRGELDPLLAAIRG